MHPSPGWPLGVVDGDADADADGLGEEPVPGSCEKNLQISPPVQVRAPSVPVDPSTGSGVWSPSKAAHRTGYPARQPEYEVTTWVRLPLAGSGGLCAVQPLARTNVSRSDRPREMSRTLSWVPWMPR